jgi:hypothetical protein
MGVLKSILRWIAVVPAWLLASIAANLVFALGSCQYDPQLSHDLSRDVEGFGGHYLMGPILVIARSVAWGWAGMVAVVYVAPAAKRETAFVFASVLTTLVGLGAILVGLQWRAGSISTETAIRVTLDAIPGIIAGFGVAVNVPHGSTDDELKRSDWLS